MNRTAYVTRLVNQVALGGGDLILNNIIERERERRFKVIRPGDVEWLPRVHWKPSSICSINGNRVRIVLVEAKTQRNGAFRRLIQDIEDMEMVPVVVEPHDRLARTLADWGWKHRRVGIGFNAENLWYPRR